MRRMHFEHETPYRCPSCRFASSFQRDVFIHFQEEHRHSLIILCPFCLRSFTVLKPDQMTREKMQLLSRLIYNHFVEHFVVSKNYACTNCCLCFLDRDHIRKHKQLHHNPLEIRPLDKVKIQPFIVTADEEKYCVKALPMELFIANKRPNMTLDQGSDTGGSDDIECSQVQEHERCIGNDDDKASNENRACQSTTAAVGSTDRQQQACTSVPGATIDVARASPAVGSGSKREEGSSILSDSGSDDNKSESSDSDADSYCTAREDGTILVRGLSDKKFLAGDGPDLRVSKSKSLTGRPKSNKNADQVSECSSQKLIEFLSKLKRADGVLPNQSVILTPKSKPAKCCECSEFIAVDHYVATICCKSCHYYTHCPRALTKHKITVHEKGDTVAEKSTKRT